MGTRLWLSGSGLAVLTALACVIPLFMGRYGLTTEEPAAYFASLYGLVPFYPGSNRILAVLQFIASPARTVQESVWIHYASEILIWSVGVTAFLVRAVPRIVGLALPLFLALFALTLLPLYALVFSPVMPYLTPLGLTLMAMSMVYPASRRPLMKVALVFGCVLLIIAAGINPTSAVIAGTFAFAHLSGTLVLDRRTFGSVRKRVYSIVVESWPLVLFGLIAVLSVFTWSQLQYRFTQAYPQSTMSNYSVESYSRLNISFASIVTSYNYFIDFVKNWNSDAWVGPVLHCIIFGAAPLGAIALWTALRKDRFVEESLAATSLYIAAMFTSVVTALNSHVLLVDNFIRGRYFIGSFIAIVIAFAIFICVSVALSLRMHDLKQLRRVGLAIFAILTLSGSSWALANNPHFYARVLPQPPDAANVAEAIRSRKVTAIVGDYWVVWPLHFLINTGEGHIPNTIPVTVRTEALPLRTFRLWQGSLMARDRMEVACIRHVPYGGPLDTTPPGDCYEKMHFNVVRGAFPKGQLVKKGIETFGDYEVTYFELSRSGMSDAATCTADNIVFRAAVRQAQDGGSATYLLRDGGFVLTGLPQRLGTRWLLTFKTTRTSEPAEQTISLLSGRSAKFSLGSAQFSIFADECRIMVGKDTGSLLSHDETEVVIVRQ